jgi:hypothetical protein
MEKLEMGSDIHVVLAMAIELALSLMFLAWVRSTINFVADSLSILSDVICVCKCGDPALNDPR